MILKALLVRELHLKGLKRHRHNLEALWERATATHPPINSDRRSETITALHRFESLGYPEWAIAEGAAMRFSLFAPAPERGDATVPWYDLVLEDHASDFRLPFHCLESHNGGSSSFRRLRSHVGFAAIPSV